jgi:hypothetical protein
MSKSIHRGKVQSHHGSNPPDLVAKKVAFSLFFLFYAAKLRKSLELSG